MSKWPMRTMRGLFCAVAAWMPSSLSRMISKAAKLSSNLDLASLSDAGSRRSVDHRLSHGRCRTDVRSHCRQRSSGRAGSQGFRQDRSARQLSVTLYEAFGRIAAASLRFAEGEAGALGAGAIPDQDIKSLKGDEFFGYPVDAGLGCYMDADSICADSGAGAAGPHAEVLFGHQLLRRCAGFRNQRE